MTDETDAPRLTGQAAWKAQLDAVEHHNANAKKQARERTSATTAANARERRLAAQEELQLRALNARIAKRP